MSTQSQLPATRNPLAMSQARSGIIAEQWIKSSFEIRLYALHIPNILENIFNYLPTTCLVRLTYVNKMWRLEARHKLYQNRGEIIYKELEWFLEAYRRHWGTPLIRFLGYRKSVDNVVKFLQSFNLNFNVELLLIRNRLKKQFEAVATINEEKLLARLEAEKLFRQDPGNTEKYNNYRKLQKEYKTTLNKIICEGKALSDFDHFLIQFNVVTPDELLNNKRYRHLG